MNNEECFVKIYMIFDDIVDKFKVRIYCIELIVVLQFLNLLIGCKYKKNVI